MAYFSENLNEAKKYSSYDKELYVVVQALKKWRHYLMPREFVLYSDNHALRFINIQPKLNQRHAKWVEFLQNFTFVIKHTSGMSNKVVDALSRIILVMKEVKINTLGFENLIAMYKDDVDFKYIYASFENPVTHNINQWLDYMLQEGLLFKNSKLCIPRCSMRENLIQEKHS